VESRYGWDVEVVRRVGRHQAENRREPPVDVYHVDLLVSQDLFYLAAQADAGGDPGEGARAIDHSAVTDPSNERRVWGIVLRVGTTGRHGHVPRDHYRRMSPLVQELRQIVNVLGDSAQMRKVVFGDQRYAHEERPFLLALPGKNAATSR
jgi:hypothetical protein